MGPRLEHWRCNANHTTIATVWDDRYSTDAAYTNSTSKQAVVVRMARDEGLLDLRSMPFDAEAAWADIATVHHQAYVDAVRTGAPRHLANSQGFDWSPEQADAVARIWSGHIAACRMPPDGRFGPERQALVAGGIGGVGIGSPRHIAHCVTP